MRTDTHVHLDHEVAIVGAGFSGIGSAVALDRAGISDFIVLEDGDGVGGAWHWNTYPGVAVDIPSFGYQCRIVSAATGPASMREVPS